MTFGITFWVMVIQMCAIFTIIGVICIAAGLTGIFSGDGLHLGLLVLLGLMILLVCSVCGGYAAQQRLFVETPSRTWTTIEIQNITSLSDGSTFHTSGRGNFFLGIGSANIEGKTTTQYVFYKVLPPGYQIGTLDATNVFIREDENTYPYIEFDYTHTTNPKKTWVDDGSVDYIMNGAQSDALTMTVIHVPTGTVIKDYVLDSVLK